LLELGEQAIDFLNLHAGTRGDAAFARGFQEVGLAPLQRCHRTNDAFHAAHVPLGAVHVGLAHVGGLAGELRGQFVHQSGQAAHLLHLRNLRQKIVQVETVTGLDLVDEPLSGLHVDAFLHLFDQADDVAHAEHAAGVALCVKDFQAVDLFADTGKLDRRAGDLAH